MEKNKGTHIAVLVIGIILYLIVWLFMGPMLTDALRPYVGIGSEIQIVLCTVLVVTNRKTGFIVTCILNLLALFSALMGALHGQTSAVTGVVIDIITILTMYIIYHFLERSEKQRQELSDQYEKLMDANRELEQKDEALKTFAYTDIMTGMNNLRYFREQMEEAIKIQSKFTIIYIDIDNFKSINDTFGPKTGDAALKAYAKRISDYCGNRYICARTAGDEFGILLIGEYTEADILNMIEQLRRLFGEQITVQGANLSITASYGIATHPRDGRNSETLLDSIIMATYTAKANGKDRPCFFSQA
ncbi:MAG: GGDEF domain-containing protein [Oscillospiraceae bacterium]|nr:GGDEF domain-containing protein [Oscillospiraceae bacterium]